MSRIIFDLFNQRNLRQNEQSLYWQQPIYFVLCYYWNFDFLFDLFLLNYPSKHTNIKPVPYVVLPGPSKCVWFSTTIFYILWEAHSSPWEYLDSWGFYDSSYFWLQFSASTEGFPLAFCVFGQCLYSLTGVSSLPHSQPLSIQTYTPSHSHKASFK